MGQECNESTQKQRTALCKNNQRHNLTQKTTPRKKEFSPLQQWRWPPAWIGKWKRQRWWALWPVSRCPGDPVSYPAPCLEHLTSADPAVRNIAPWPIAEEEEEKSKWRRRRGHNAAGKKKKRTTTSSNRSTRQWGKHTSNCSSHLWSFSFDKMAWKIVILVV